MPRICEFRGIVITMQFEDHAPPHFHARYEEFEALIRIDSAEVSEGWLPIRVQRLVTTWTRAHREELAENWLRARRRLSLKRIEPLR